MATPPVNLAGIPEAEDVPGTLEPAPVPVGFVQNGIRYMRVPPTAEVRGFYVEWHLKEIGRVDEESGISPKKEEADEPLQRRECAPSAPLCLLPRAKQPPRSPASAPVLKTPSPTVEAQQTPPNPPPVNPPTPAAASLITPLMSMEMDETPRHLHRGCWNCGGLRHNWVDCQAPAEYFCHDCANREVRVAACPNCRV